MSTFTCSGLALTDIVVALHPRFVVDIGCGFNEFKGGIPNLIGIDLVNDHADLVCNFHDAPIAPNSIDVALALGSINFGTEDDVLIDLTTVHRWLVTGGSLFMRANPGFEIGGNIAIFPWSRSDIPRLGAQVGFNVGSTIEDDYRVTPSGERQLRLFWRYVKSSPTP